MPVLPSRGRPHPPPPYGLVRVALAQLAVEDGNLEHNLRLEKDREKVYNSAVILDRAGRIVLKHRKIDTLPFVQQKKRCRPGFSSPVPPRLPSRISQALV